MAVPAGHAQAPAAADNGPWRLEEALGLPDGLRIGGSIRPRYEALANPFVAGRTEDDEALSLQTQLRAEYDLGSSGLTLGGELLDSRFIAGNETGGAPGEVDTLEPAQAYLAWRPTNFLGEGARLDLTLGRFTMDVGSRRLVARANYRNILASFDGAKATWTSSTKQSVTFAYAAPTAREPADAASAIENEVALNSTFDNVRFGVAMAEFPLPQYMLGELYLLRLEEDDDADTASRNRDLSTFGARLRRIPAADTLDFDLEYARQTGSQHATTNPLDVTALDHEADMAHLEVGYSFKGPWSPRIALQYDHASGDKSPADLGSHRFDPLFGDRSFEFGPTGLYGFIARTNLSSPGIRLELKPDINSDAYVMLRDVRLDEARDSFANSGVRDAAGLSGDHAGVQVEGRYRTWLVKDSLRLALGAAVVMQGDFLENAPNATGQGDPLLGYSELTWTF